MKIRCNLAFLITAILVLVMLGEASAAPVARIKDIARVDGVRNNQLTGYGLVMGVAGTGDTDKTIFTAQSIASMLKTFGITVSASQFKVKNVAAVMVTATLPPFVRSGDTLDVTVSSLGDAKSLQGGTLIMTPLKAANGTVYAVAQGPVSVGGFSVSAGGSSASKNFTTAGRVPNGALVEREVSTAITDGSTLNLVLHQPDFTTATRVVNAINGRFGEIAGAKDAGTVTVGIPGEYTNSTVGFVAALEDLLVSPDMVAKVVINERTGTIVMGSDVGISEVAVAQGNLQIRIKSGLEVSQPPPLSRGSTVVTPTTDLQVEEPPASLIVLPSSANVGDVVKALNAAGATPRDIIAILQGIKAAGALQAELEII
ncbi:MAG: flagellar basal body P-ring protein FlgI [Bacillota bacterium]